MANKREITGVWLRYSHAPRRTDLLHCGAYKICQLSAKGFGDERELVLTSSFHKLRKLECIVYEVIPNLRICCAPLFLLSWTGHSVHILKECCSKYPLNESHCRNLRMLKFEPESC